MSPYLVGAYAVFWLGAFIYLLSLGARQRALERKIERLSAAVKQEGEA